MSSKEKLVQMVGMENATKWVDLVQSMLDSDAIIPMDEVKIPAPVLTESQN